MKRGSKIISYQQQIFDIKKEILFRSLFLHGLQVPLNHAL